MVKKLGIYVHWPFCKSLCPYCDFNSHVSKSPIDMRSMLKSYLDELTFFANQINVDDFEVQSIFFGGGTPSLADPFVMEGIINYVKKTFKCVNTLEITLESNPSSVENAKMQAFKNAGINRVSIGVQSLNNKDLKWLGRAHNSNEALEAIDIVSNLFNNFSFDLIYGRKNQEPQDWQEELNNAIKLAKDHMSIYCLAIEKGTEFFAQHKAGKLNAQSGEKLDELYDITQNTMLANNFRRYEISNYVNKNNGSVSVHNMLYWQIDDYIGIGAGAHGRLHYKNGIRMQTMDFHNPNKWLEKDASLKQQQCIAITKQQQALEIIMMGLRIDEGINVNDINEKLGINILNYINMQSLQTLLQNGFINVTKSNNVIQLIKPTTKGMDTLNSVVKMLAI